MNDILKIKKERVLKVSEQCPNAKRVLKILFPDAFKKEKISCIEGGFYMRTGDTGEHILYRIVKYRTEKKDEYMLVTMCTTHEQNLCTSWSGWESKERIETWLNNGEFTYLGYGR